MKKSCSILLLVLITLTSHSQDLAFGRKIVDTLTSPYFWGRGYTKDGMSKAADFIAGQFKAYGLSPMNGNSYLQDFTYPVNTFPGKMEVTVNGKLLVPGKDFIVSPDSRGIKAKGNLMQADSIQFVNQQNRVIVKLEDKLTWSVDAAAADYTMIELDKKSMTALPENFKMDIDNK